MLASIIVACSLIHGASSLINGTQALRDAYPWFARVLVNERGTNFTCGATILNNRHVITTFSCYGSGDLYVTVGSYRPDVMAGSEQTVKVVKTFIHPRFDVETLQNDVAIYRTEEFTFSEYVQPVSLPDRIFDRSVRSDCWLVGFGLIGQDPDVSPTALQQLQTTVLPKKTCKQKAKNKLDLKIKPKESTCSENDNAGPCAGDEGGPMLCYDSDNGLYRLIGLLSTGHFEYNDCSRGFNVYTRVASYLVYISKILSRP